MFNTVIDSSTTLNMLLSFLGGIVLTITCFIIYFKNNWEKVKSYVGVIIIAVMFCFPMLIGIIFLIFGLGPSFVDNFIYLSKPKEYKIQILKKEISEHTQKTTTKKVGRQSTTTTRTSYNHIIHTTKWWDNNSEMVSFSVTSEEYNKLYEKEYVYIKSYKGIFGYQHLYRDKDFLRPDEDANKTIKNTAVAKKVILNKGQKEVILNQESRIVSFNGNGEYKPINSDWKPCEKTSFKGRTEFKTKDNSKIFIGLPSDNSVKVKSNTEIDLEPAERVKNSNITTARLYNGNVICSTAPTQNGKKTLRTLVSNFEIYGNAAVYQINYSKKTKKTEVIVRSGFVNIKLLKSENGRTPGIGKSYKMVFDEEKETSLSKINLDDYDWD